MKRKGYIVLAASLLLIGTVLFVLNSSGFQRKVIYSFSNAFVERSHSSLVIGHASINLFRGIVLHDVVLSDSTGSVFLKADRLEAGIRILPLFRKKIEFHALRVIKASVHLFRHSPEEPLNIASFLQSFHSDDGKPSSMHFRLRSVVLKECNLTYDVLSEPEMESVFDSNHFSVNKLSSLIRLSITPDNTSTFEVVKLTIDDLCGMAIGKMAFKGSIDDHMADIKDFLIKTDASQVEIPSLRMSYSSYKAFTNLADSVFFSPLLIKGKITPSEWSAFYPKLTDLPVSIDFSISMEGKINDLLIKRIRLSMVNMALFDGRFSLKQLSDFPDFSVDGKVSLLKIFPQGFDYFSGLITREKTQLTPLHALGAVSYMGNVSTRNKQVEVKGDFTTAAGNLGMNLIVSRTKEKPLQFKGKIETSSFDLSRLSNKQTYLGQIALNVSVEGSRQPNSTVSGNVEGLISKLNLAGYEYQNLTLSGSFNDKSFEGKAKLDDENAKLDFQGLFDVSGEHAVFKFDLLADHVDLYGLNILEGEQLSDLSFRMQSDFTGKSADDIQGILTIKDIAFYNNGQWLKVDEIRTKAIQRDSCTVYTVESDLFNGSLSGQFEFSQLAQAFRQLLYQYIPSAFTSPSFKDPSLISNFDIHATLEPSQALTKVLNLPFNYQETIHLDGFFRHQLGKFRLKAVIPEVYYGKSHLRLVNVLFENPLNEAKFIAHAQAGVEGEYVDIDMDVRTLNDQSVFKFFWSNSGTKTHTGTVSGNILFGRNLMGKSLIDIGISPSDLVVNDTIWRIHPTTINLDDKRLFIDKLQLTHGDEFIRIDGYASELLTDTLSVTFNSFRLDDLIRLLPKSELLFGGNITGSAKFPHLLKNGSMDASLEVDQFSINEVVLGDLQATTFWDKHKKTLNLNGSVYTIPEPNKPVRQLARATGSFFPLSDSLLLDIDADKVPLDFLDPYLGLILQDMKGLGSGHVRLVGPVKELGIYTRVYVEDASFRIEMLNTRYSFSDSLFLTPRTIVFDNIKATDKEGHIGYASGLIRHNKFKNMQTQIDVRVNNMLAMDIPASPNALFYGTAYATGTLKISGTEDNTVMDINMRTDERTKVSISLMEKSELEDYNYIQFVNFGSRRYKEEITGKTSKKEKQTESILKKAENFTINLQIEATPNAELTLITDPNTGDEIKARGSGAIRAVINEVADINLFGRYTIENGSYRFIYEDILRRDFSIVRNSSINFSGDPFKAELDIAANYTVDAQLSDLIPTSELASLNLTKNSIPVNCVLKLAGELQRPDISLDLAYPSADEELVRRIKNVINTDEAINQQIVYLLLFGRFSTPSTNVTAGQSNVSSVLNTAISTLSSQVNSILNNAIGYSNLSFDIDYQNAAYESGTPGEIKVGMSGQWLDDRLTFQGNVGSREDLTEVGTSQFIGEFDLNLRMKNTEKWSWKLFNRANDNQYFKSALNTQGFGVVYNEEYNNLAELFRQMVESLKKPFAKKTAE